MQETTWGRLAIVLRTGLPHAVWLIRSRHVPVPTLPSLSSRPRCPRAPQERLWHTAVTNTLTYAHVLNRGGKGRAQPGQYLVGPRSRCGLYGSAQDAKRKRCR